MWLSDRAALLEELRLASRGARKTPKKGAVDCLCMAHELPVAATREALEIAAAEWPSPGGSLLLFTDVTDFDLFGRLGRRVEILPTRSAWNTLSPGPAYESFVAERTAHVISMYQPLRLIGVGGASRAAIRAARGIALSCTATPGAR